MTKEDDAMLEVLKRMLLPISEEFNYVPYDIFPLKGGGFLCMMCAAHTDSPELQDLKHNEFCIYLEKDVKFETHGEARGAYKKGKENDMDKTTD